MMELRHLRRTVELLSALPHGHGKYTPTAWTKELKKKKRAEWQKIQEGRSVQGLRR